MGGHDGSSFEQGVRELVAGWRRRLSGDDGIGWLRKYGGIGAWYQRLASVPQVARAVATELERDPQVAIEVEQLREYLAVMELPHAERSDRLARLEVGDPMEWRDAVAFTELSADYALRFDAWLARAREIELGTTPTSCDPLGVGAEVRHPTFGHGVVQAKSGATLTVAFSDGIKRVLARFVTPTAEP